MSDKLPQFFSRPNGQVHKMRTRGYWSSEHGDLRTYCGLQFKWRIIAAGSVVVNSTVGEIQVERYSPPTCKNCIRTIRKIENLQRRIG